VEQVPLIIMVKSFAGLKLGDGGQISLINIDNQVKVG
jgi:hypothetical protein